MRFELQSKSTIHQFCTSLKKKKITLSLSFEHRKLSSETPFFSVFSAIPFYTLNLSFLLSFFVLGLSLGEFWILEWGESHAKVAFFISILM